MFLTCFCKDVDEFDAVPAMLLDRVLSASGTADVLALCCWDFLPPVTEAPCCC